MIILIILTTSVEASHDLIDLLFESASIAISIELFQFRVQLRSSTCFSNGWQSMQNACFYYRRRCPQCGVQYGVLHEVLYGHSVDPLINRREMSLRLSIGLHIYRCCTYGMVAWF